VPILFTYYKKTYDSIHKESVFKTLEEYGMPQKLINLIRYSIRHIDIKVNVRHFLSKTVQLMTRLKQGGAMSPILFNLAMENVMKDATINREGVR